MIFNFVYLFAYEGLFTRIKWLVFPSVICLDSKDFHRHGLIPSMILNYMREWQDSSIVAMAAR